MKIKILRSTMAGKKPCKVGQIVEVDDKEGRFLIGTEFAEEVKAVAKQAKPAAPPAAPAPGKAE
jgi:hypothetical protein